LVKIQIEKHFYSFGYSIPGEALGAIGTDECLEIVSQYIHDDSQEVAETCVLAVSRIGQAIDIQEGRLEDPYRAGVPVYFNSVDPAFPLDDETDAHTLGDIARTEAFDIYLRYTALFQLRNMRSTEAVLELAKSKGHTPMNSDCYGKYDL